MASQVNRIMGRMDTVVAKLKTRESKLTENIDILQKSEAHEGHLVTVQVIISFFSKHQVIYIFLPEKSKFSWAITF